MIDKVIGHIEENNRNKYLVFMIFQIKTKQYLKKKYAERQHDIKTEIQTTNGGKTGEYGKNFIKIEFDTDDDL